jgi:membrane associated rhomboid family serine protease
MVGVQLERDIKTIPFLILNLITAIVAGVFQLIANMISVYLIFGTFNPFELETIGPAKKLEILFEHGPWLYSMLNSVTIGASGCVFGVLTAFAYLYPKNKIRFLSEVQISTRFIIICYLILQVYNGITLSHNGIAHFAHLGGSISGLLIAIYYKKKYHLKFEV